ncbi:MAG: hypothetical protein S4CHLAM102_13460 [Chlamydiia bacterium]|nr:hypothetical protein [Chlamydiia bacterium]
MNFTRDPIIETIISPREGYKLSIRNSKGGHSEEYQVDALEVVSFGAALFYRHLEKPRPFMVPVGDYEVVEVRETRLIPKKPVVEKTIKIAGGKENKAAKAASEEDGAQSGNQSAQSSGESRRKKGRRSRRSSGDKAKKEETAPKAEEGEVKKEQVVTPAVFREVLAPPKTLISQTLAKARPEEGEKSEKVELVDGGKVKSDAKPKQEPQKSEAETKREEYHTGPSQVPTDATGDVMLKEGDQAKAEPSKSNERSGRGRGRDKPKLATPPKELVKPAPESSASSEGAEAEKVAPVLGGDSTSD